MGELQSLTLSILSPTGPRPARPPVQWDADIPQRQDAACNTMSATAHADEVRVSVRDAAVVSPSLSSNSPAQDDDHGEPPLDPVEYEITVDRTDGSMLGVDVVP